MADSKASSDALITPDNNQTSVLVIHGGANKRATPASLNMVTQPGATDYDTFRPRNTAIMTQAQYDAINQANGGDFSAVNGCEILIYTPPA